MSHPFDDIRARLGRADENIVNLKRELLDFKRENPYVVGTHLDEQSRQLTQTIHQEPAPPRLSVLAGEILFLLRSTLDHIIAQILIPITLPSDLDKVLERSAFPVFTEQLKWKSFDWTKIPGISAQVRTVITAYQPCNRTDGLAPDDYPLAILTSLNNIDKHRTLLVLTNKIAATHRLDLFGGVQVHTMKIHPNINSTELDTELASWDVSLGPSGGVNVDSQVTVQIAFKQFGTVQAEPVIPALQGLLRFVTNLTDDFQRQFFP